MGLAHEPCSGGRGADHGGHAGDGVDTGVAVELHEERGGVAGGVAAGAEGEQVVVGGAVDAVEREDVMHGRLHGRQGGERVGQRLLLGERAWLGWEDSGNVK